MSGPWFRKIDDHWSIWVNGRMKPAKVGPRIDVEIQPGDCYVEFNGWPAGLFSMIDPRDGDVMAAGGLANYRTFCEALSAAIQKGVPA
jgi:hypothetical protein